MKNSTQKSLYHFIFLLEYQTQESFESAFCFLTRVCGGDHPCNQGYAQFEVFVLFIPKFPTTQYLKFFKTNKELNYNKFKLTHQWKIV